MKMLMDFSLLPIDLLIVMDLLCKWCVCMFCTFCTRDWRTFFSKGRFCAIQVLVETDFTVLYSRTNRSSHMLSEGLKVETSALLY